MGIVTCRLPGAAKCGDRHWLLPLGRQSRHQWCDEADVGEA